MADKKEKAAENSKVEKATTDEAKAAEKVAKAAKGESKNTKPNFFVRARKGTKTFFKDFKGECKKIVWPDAKTVLKSTGIVILVVAIVSIIIFGIDSGLSAGVKGLKNLATGSEETTVSQTADEHDHDHDEDGKEETKKDDASKEDTTKSEKPSDDSTKEATE